MSLVKWNRPGTLAVLAAVGGSLCLALGLFLAVAKESAASETVQVRSVGDGGTIAIARTATSDDDQKHGFLGVHVEEDTSTDEGGALVRRVIEDSPAAKAGLKDGDVIVGFDSAVVRGPEKLTEKIRGTKVGDKVQVEVRRAGKREKLTVEMGERPNWSYAWKMDGKDIPGMTPEQQRALEDSLRNLDKGKIELEHGVGKLKIHGPLAHGVWVLGNDKPLLGVELVELTPELREVMGGRKDAGVLIGRVLPDTPAEKCGLKVGDLVLSVDGDAVADASDLAEAVRDRQGKTIDLEISRDKKIVHVKAVIPEEKEDDTPHGPRAGAPDIQVWNPHGFFGVSL